MRSNSLKRRLTLIAVCTVAAFTLTGVGIAVAQNIAANPLYGTVNLTTGFTPDPHTVNVRAGGPNPVSVSGMGTCTGYINASRPDVDLNFSAGSLPLNIYVRSGADTTLVVNLPDGRWICDDDSGGGTNPLIRMPNPQSGQYNIWVGNYGNSDTPSATLFISESEPR